MSGRFDIGRRQHELHLDLISSQFYFNVLMFHFFFLPTVAAAIPYSPSYAVR